MASVHIAPDAGGWVVRVEGAEQPVATFRLENEALTYGRDFARRHSMNLVAHFADGRVRFTERPMPRGPGGD